MEIVNAEKGWRAVYLINTASPEQDHVDDYLSCGLAVSVSDVLVWVCPNRWDEFIVGLDLEPIDDDYCEKDLEDSPHTVHSFVGYLPPDVTVDFLNSKAQMMDSTDNGLSTDHWLRREE